MKLNFTVYIPGENDSDAAAALRSALKDLDPHMPYSEMMRYRASGKAANECKDIYYLCTDESNRLISRLWMGFGKHDNAIGNWGNFFTAPEYRGQGIGHKMLDFWLSDIAERTDLPSALFCTAGSIGLTKLYEPYGFKTAISNTEYGPLYRPLGKSPNSFQEFCKEYYKPSKKLIFKKASLEWRHEIDCLFKFAMLDAGLDYLPDGMLSLEASLLENQASNVEIIFTDTNIPVGVAMLHKDGKKDARIYPSYMHLI